MGKNAEKKIKNKYYVYVGILFILYLIICISYFAENYYNVKKGIYSEIDNNLLIGAKTLRYLFAEDFHDRAIDEDSISYEEEMANRNAVNQFVSENKFTWAYTLAEKDGEFFFSAPTVSEEEAKERKRWYFLPYEDIPEEFKIAYSQEKIIYAEYTDQWGEYRSVAVPQFSSGGRKYIACIDYDVSYVKRVLFSRMIYNIVAVFIFTLVGSVFLWIYKFYIRAVNELESNIMKNQEKLDEEEHKLKVLEDIKIFYQKQAMNDQMTGLLNKGYFFEKMKEELIKSEEKKSKLSLLMIDIDDFKDINDENGHIFGDEVIKVVGKIIQENSRKSEIIGRYGGDEFIVALPDTSFEIAMTIGRRICDAVRSFMFRNESKKFSTTVSIGVTEYDHGEKMEEFLDRADHHLYVAKYKKKNRVEGAKKKN